MPLPLADTKVSYPAGDTERTATVVHTESLGDGHTVVLLDATPCHPVDASWPDQGADRATLSWGGSTAAIVDCVVAATDGTALHLGDDIPVRKGTEGWAFVVAHVIAGRPPGPGDTVTVTVDAGYRRALSLGHTGCHLASLALNRAVADRWAKEAPADALGTPNFDGVGCDSSRILPGGSVDTYRLNKSLRRKGFVTDGLAGALPVIEAAVNEQLASWTASGAAVRVDRDGDALTDRRHWVCALPEGDAIIPCGGTHATSLGELGTLRCTLELTDVDGTPVLTMRTGVA